MCPVALVLASLCGVSARAAIVSLYGGFDEFQELQHSHYFMRNPLDPLPNGHQGSSSQGISRSVLWLFSVEHQLQTPEKASVIARHLG